ncbi:MAG: hypothetical protein MN733_20290 [Nitrososphaera sp.]|nr:hypothetical protein [Nitrososphaera sp.]
MPNTVKLFGAGLTPIDTPTLVGRYNECLMAMGVEPTSLERFSVDGGGWSPEIAEEKNDRLYLSQGIANPLGIAIRPEQEGKPVYMPFFSFHRLMMKVFFKAARAKIVYMTTRTGIWIDFDENLSDFSHPYDLLMIDSVNINSHTGDNIMDEARKQREMTRKFRESPDAWADENFRRQVEESGKRFGDFRHRDVVIQTIPFMNTRDFYARAFGGVYVLRETRSGEHLLVLEDEGIYETFGRGSKDMLSLKDPSLFDRLFAEGLIECSLDRYMEDQGPLWEKWHMLLADAMYANDPEMDYGSLSTASQKAYVRRHKNEIPEVFFELERLICSLKKRRVPSKESLSSALFQILAVPSQDVGELLQGVICQLIHHVVPLDILGMYTCDKNHFATQYEGWPAGKQRHAEKLIQGRYVPEMSKVE